MFLFYSHRLNSYVLCARVTPVCLPVWSAPTSGVRALLPTPRMSSLLFHKKKSASLKDRNLLVKLNLRNEGELNKWLQYCSERIASSFVSILNFLCFSTAYLATWLVEQFDAFFPEEFFCTWSLHLCLKVTYAAENSAAGRPWWGGWQLTNSRVTVYLCPSPAFRWPRTDCSICDAPIVGKITSNLPS